MLFKLNKRKETPVKFNLGLSANRPSNNWALGNKIIGQLTMQK